MQLLAPPVRLALSLGFASAAHGFIPHETLIERVQSGRDALALPLQPQSEHPVVRSDHGNHVPMGCAIRVRAGCSHRFEWLSGYGLATLAGAIKLGVSVVGALIITRQMAVFDVSDHALDFDTTVHRCVYFTKSTFRKCLEMAPFDSLGRGKKNLLDALFEF